MHIIDGPTYVSLLVEVGAGLTAVAIVARATRTPRQWCMRLLRKLDRGLDDVVGVPETRHPITGEVVVPAIPGIGQRMQSVESTLIQLVERDAAVSEAKSIAHKALEVAEQVRGEVHEHIQRCEPSLGVIADKALDVASAAQQANARHPTAAH